MCAVQICKTEGHVQTELVIGLAGILLSVFTFFVGVWITERRQKRQDSQERIQRILDSYMEMRRTGETAELDGLQKAGVATLHDDEEIRKLVTLIMQHGENDPLQRGSFELDGVDLKAFFGRAAEEHISFFNADEVRDLIKKVKDA